MTLLIAVNGAFGRLGLPTTTSVIGNSTALVQEMLALANQEGRELSRRGAWKLLQAEKTFTTTAAAEQVGALPSDLDWIIPDTMFDRTLNRMVDGPASPSEWQLYQAVLSARVWPTFRIRGTSLLVAPTPTAGRTMVYEYVTKNWCQSSAAAGQSAWAADDDTAVLDEELHTLGLIWRFKHAKGLDYSDSAALYDLQVRQAMIREGVRPRLSSDPARRSRAAALAGARPNVLLTTDGSGILWD